MEKSLKNKEITKKEVVPTKKVRAKAVSVKKPSATKNITVKDKAVKIKKLASKKVISAKKTNKIAVTEEKIKTDVKTKLKTSHDETVVSIPSTASLRLLEKVEVYKLWYQEMFPEYVAKTAKVAGYSFILLGVIFASFSYLIINNNLSNPAAIVCSGSDTNCSEISNSQLPAGAPLVTFINTLPPLISGDIDFSLSLENAQQLTTYILSTQTGTKIILNPVEVTEGSLYKYLIRYADLSNGSHVIVSEVDDGSIKYKFNGSSFSTDKAAEETFIEIPAVAAPVLVASTTEEVSKLGDVLVATTEAEATELTDTSTSPESKATSSEVSLKEISISHSELPVSLTLNQLRDSNFLKIRTGNFAPELVEVYMQNNGSNRSVFLGLATLVQSEWIFSLDALDLPTSSNYIFASFVKDGVEYKTESVLYNSKVNNATSLPVNGEDSLLVEKVNLVIESANLSNRNRNAYLSESAESLVEAKEFANESLLSSVSAKIDDNKLTINDLLFKYAVAVQGNNDFIIQLADNKIDKNSSILALEIAKEVGSPSSYTNIKTVLALQFNKYKEKIRVEESKLAQETNGLISRDSDLDGVSDFDEIVNFFSDHRLADSDHDGVIDSIEIVTNTNANVADIAERLTFNHSTDDVAVTDSLSITNVTSLLVKNSKNNTELHHYVVSGVGIPNSFMNIVAGEPGVVGIIRTNSTGEFSYTLEKELTKGSRFAYLALPDNSGNMIATSKIFQLSQTLNKQAAAAQAANSSDYDDGLPQIVTAGVGVVSLGLILLLLSLAIGSRRQTKLTTKTA